jgi:hypothetical protein
MRTTKFGEQPLRSIILNDGRTLAGFARTLKCDKTHTLLAIAGRVPPSPQLRAELTARLGLPVEVLFTASALAATYKPQHRPRRVSS